MQCRIYYREEVSHASEFGLFSYFSLEGGTCIIPLIQCLKLCSNCERI